MPKNYIKKRKKHHEKSIILLNTDSDYGLFIYN